MEERIQEVSQELRLLEKECQKYRGMEIMKMAAKAAKASMGGDDDVDGDEEEDCSTDRHVMNSQLDTELFLRSASRNLHASSVEGSATRAHKKESSVCSMPGSVCVRERACKFGVVFYTST